MPSPSPSPSPAWTQSTSSPLSLRQAADGEADQAGRDGVACAQVRACALLPHIWGEMKSCSYCQESTMSTGATCVFMQVCMVTFMGVKQPRKPYIASVGQKQLVNLCIHRQAVDFLCSWKHSVQQMKACDLTHNRIITTISLLMVWPRGKRWGVKRLEATRKVLSGWGVSQSVHKVDCQVTSWSLRSSYTHTHTPWLDAAYQGNVGVCVRLVFVGIHECLHSFLWMCVFELSEDKLLVLLSLHAGLLSHLVAFIEQELSQVGAILRRQKTTC